VTVFIVHDLLNPRKALLNYVIVSVPRSKQLL